MKHSYLFLIACMLLCISCSTSDTCPDATCDNYVTHSAAQAVYDADPECFGELDHDSDGLACEHLISGGGGVGGGCPTTSNCGCSGFNKDRCGGSCCKWIVGTGCRCK